MPLQTNSLQTEDGVVQIVKNTFITMLPSSNPPRARRQKSLPASMRLRLGCEDSLDFRAHKERLLSEILSDACTDITSDDDASSIVPISDSDETSSVGLGLSPVSPEIDDSPTFGMSPVNSDAGDWPSYQNEFSLFDQPFETILRPSNVDSSSNEFCSLCEPAWQYGRVEMPIVSTQPKSTPLRSKLNGKAVAFKPMEENSKSRLNAAPQSFWPKATPTEEVATFVEEPPKPTAEKFSYVIREVVKLLQNAEIITKVEVCESSQDCSIILQMGAGDDSLTEQAIALAKKALLEATSHSKSVYVMGYCSPNPFTMHSQGFEATLGAMENAGQACWHLFKKGFCRHDETCKRQHPNHKMPVRVLVERAQFRCSSPDDAIDFNLRVSDFVTTVTSALKQHNCVAQVDAHRNSSSKCWRIEVSPSQGSKVSKEQVLNLAKEALFGLANSTEVIYMMGFNAKPFLSRQGGFVTVLGDMRAETRACWDLYSCGFCRRECDCRWEHPNCLVPVSVMIKPSKKRISSR